MGSQLERLCCCVQLKSTQQTETSIGKQLASGWAVPRAVLPLTQLTWRRIRDKTALLWSLSISSSFLSGLPTGTTQPLSGFKQ